MVNFKPKELYEALRQNRRRETAEEFKEEYRNRAGIEGTISQGVRAFGLRKSRYMGIWTHRDGRQEPKRQLLDELGSGQLKYSKLETSNVSITVYDDTAVVRGASLLQRSAFPGSTDSGDASPFPTFFTLTFINRGGAWKAVAMHTSRP
jgi:hypothetical protein